MKMEFLKNFLCFCLLCSVTAQSNKPNIILLIADDLGWNDVGFHGSNEIPTPNIDALAYNGIILNRHYTQPTCTPSRAALMTGKYPIRFGLQGEPLKEGTPDSLALNETLLPQHLKELGYSTNLIGKWHLGFYKEGCTPTARGFDRHFGYYNGWARYNDSVTFTKQNGEDVIGLDAWENNQHAGEKLRNKYNTDVFTDEAINIIKSHNTKKPLFLDLSFTAVHAIFNCQLQVRDLQQNEKQFAYIKDPNRRMFAGVLSALDESVGRIMEALHRKNILNNTIVLFMADNGGATEDSEGLFQNYASNWPLRGWKSSVTEGGIRGAAAIWSPLIKKNYVSERTTHLIDWLPTFYAAAGGDTSQLGDIDGINQWNFLKDPDNKVHNHKRKLLLNIDEVKGDEAIIDGNWKFIRILSKPKSFGGSSGRDDEYSYNMTSVMTSPTNRVIGVYSNRTAIKLKEKFWKLRNKAKIDKYCKNRLNDTNNENGSNARCFEKGCLFHINKDHCEFHDLSKVHKNKYKALQKKLNKFRASLVKQKASSFDPNSDPKYYDGYWTPWIEDEIEN